jgi:hypothetical protein
VSYRPDTQAHTIILAPYRLRQGNHEFEASLGYKARSCLNKQPTITRKDVLQPDPLQELRENTVWLP